MSTLNQLREGLSRAWDSMQEGWSELRQRTSHALTRFQPRHRQATGQATGVETADEQLAASASRWALLPAEVIEHEDEVVVRLEMPGMERQDFDLSVVENVLVVRGEKRVQREQSSGRYYAIECAYGSFERAVPLPAVVDEQRARAAYNNGVLKVVLPKAAAARSRRIPVTTA